MKKYNILSIFIMCAAFSSGSYAQTNAFGSGYFQNQYLYNPAMSGLKSKQLNLNTSYMGQTNSVSNSPKSIYVTGDYAFSNSVGAGLSVFNDRAGLLSYTKIVGTYSYHIRVGSQEQLVSFGLSAIGLTQNLNTNTITANPDDQALYNFNDRNMQFESDFGAAYTDGKLTAQATLPNIVSLFETRERTVLNQATLFAAAAYKFKVNDDQDAVTIEPKVAYRGFKDIKSVVDGGANVVFLKDVFNVYGLYHSTKYATFGLGIKVLDAVQLSAAFNTTPSGFDNISIGGQFEFGLRFYFGTK